MVSRRFLSNRAFKTNPTKIGWITFVLAVLLGSATAFAASVIDPNAAIVLLRHRSADPNSGCGKVDNELPNCFESMPALFDLNTGWVWDPDGRNPTASTPLLVDIGPGTFGAFSCKDNGYVTLRGSGRLATKLLSDNTSDAPGAEIENCDDLDFMDLTVAAESETSSVTGVRWTGSGFSNWTNVDILANSSMISGSIWAWQEATTPCTPPADETTESEHYFFSTRMIAITSDNTTNNTVHAGFEAHCSTNWFFGGEIVGIAEEAAGAVGAYLINHGDLRAFGSPIRGKALSVAAGVSVLDDGVLHLHGGNVAASALGEGGWAIAVSISGNGFMHTVGTAMRPTTSFSSGTADRLFSDNGNPRIESPLFWYAGTEAPTANLDDPAGSSFTKSITGNDMYVETDCNDIGNCAGGGSEPHLMIYSASCMGTEGPWFDTVTGACRAGAPSTACNNDGVCDAGEDCNNCPNDCASVTGGKPAGRYCCGDGVEDSAEGDGTICDGNY